MREKMVHTRLLGVWLTNETKYLITSTKNALYKIGCPIKKGMGGYNGGNFKLTTNTHRNISKKVEAPEVGKSSWALRPQLPLTTMMR